MFFCARSTSSAPRWSCNSVSRRRCSRSSSSRPATSQPSESRCALDSAVCALLLSLVFLRRQDLDFIYDRVDFLVQHRTGTLQGIELPFTGGDGDLPGLQLRLSLLQARLEGDLFAQQGSLVAARIVDLVPQPGQTG